jgi:hypothetical protein
MADRSVTVRLKADISSFSRGLAAAGAEAKAFAGELDSSNSRMSNLIQTATALGPALIPVMAGATVAVTALGTSLTFAAAGAGVAVMALNGIGDAMSAMDKYQLQPTAANLEALRVKLSELGPAGIDFVQFLDTIQPKLKALQDTAEAGLLPGLQEGIDSVMTQFPIINDLFATLSSTMGDLAASAGEALTSPFWTDFLEDFSRSASDALSTMSEGIGNVITGFAGMFQAFLPVSTDFNHELLKLTESFSAWGQGLSENQGFQDFIQYARDNGPAVAEAFAAISEALIGIVKAGAPIGHLLLPVITELAQGFAAIANSPAGPILFGMAAGLSALARSIALMQALNATALFAGIAKLGGPEVTKATVQMRALGAGIGVLALSLTDLDDKMGVSGILTGAALGSIAGPWGAALGASIGLITTYTSTLSHMNDTIEQTRELAASDPFAFSAIASSSEAAQKSLDESTTATEQLSAGLRLIPVAGAYASAAFDHLAGQTHEASQQILADSFSFLKNMNDIGRLRSVMGEGFTSDPKVLQDFAAKTSQAFVLAGHSVEQFQRLVGSDRGQQRISQIVDDYAKSLDAVPGRTAAVKAAIAGLDDSLLSTADAASALQTAMDDLFGPQLGLVAATDAYTTALRHLEDSLASNNRLLTGNSDGAIQNRAAIGDLVQKYEEVQVAGARVGETADQFTARLKDNYYALIRSGAAAGIARGDMVDYLKTIGLTPRTINTFVKLHGAEVAAEQAKKTMDAYNALPKDVRTDIAANGISAHATADSLMKKYDGLNRKQVETILAARDNASIKIAGVNARLSGLDGRSATTYLNVVTRYSHIGVPGGDFPADYQPVADGAVFYGNGGTRENHVAQIARPGAWRVWAEPETGGEAYIPLAPQKRGRSRQIADETVNRLGGRVEWAADGMLRGQQGGYGSTASQTRSFGPDDMRQALNGMKLALDVGGQRTLTTIIHAGAQTIVDAEADHNSAMRRSGRRPR